MKILRFLNNKTLLILLSLLLFQNCYSNEPVDIWNLEKKLEENNNITNDIEKLPSNSVYENQLEKNSEIIINEEKNILSKKLNIVGIYDPSANDLTMDMWVNSNGKKILEVIEKINNMNLSNDSLDILNTALLTNSYFPNKNITSNEFLKIKSDFLIKNKNFNLIESYIEKNKYIEESSSIIQYYVDHYLSRFNLSKACEIFNKIDSSINDQYLLKFNIYCLINSNENDEAQLHFDLLKETGFEDIFFEQRFAFLMGYQENIDNETSEKSILDFHLSHRTNTDFKFEPKLNTSKLIWKYLSSANLLESVNLIDLEDKDKIFTIEKATHEKNYDENELFTLYERFMFNINQLLSVEETYKLLSNSEGRAILYQGILINKEASEKIKLIKLLKESFIKDGITNAFDNTLTTFLDKIGEGEIPSDYTDFYQLYSKKININKKKVKFNNKIIHQSKLLDYFNNNSNRKNVEIDLDNLFKKIKKNKKYFFSIKDIILLESLKSDGVKISKKYEKIYKPTEPNIPYDIQILINKDEMGLALLRIVEIIGEDKIEDMDPETSYFIISILNQLDIDKLRNELLLKVLPLKV